MKSKAALLLSLAILVISTWNLHAQTTQLSNAPSRYEFRVMPLFELVGDSAAGKEKIGQLVIHDNNNPLQRTDLDVPDYQEAIDRLAKDGWEPVTVNHSNYWVFRRLRQQR